MDAKSPSITSRRRFLAGLGAAGAAAAAVGTVRAFGAENRPAGYGAGKSTTGAPDAATAGAPLPDWFPRQDPALVQQVVGAAHRDLAEVTRLVERRPELAKSQWDWGYGDWESPLDAASHTGQREIALFVIRHGARPTIFSAAMLGQLEVVRQFVLASPGIQGTPGPHGIPLLAHAKAGGEPAAAVVDYLVSVGGADGPPRQQLAEAEHRRYLGAYRFGSGAGDVFEVTPLMKGLGIARRGGQARGLVPLGNHEFHPAGAPSVRVRFEAAGELATSVAIYQPELVVRATRVAAEATSPAARR
ncbi:MAG TPA: twin-arginine translocation signal domain-containing protein [Thermoanaerobaculia bacterium]|nr:twin-arginine translocation signal domain-containing protein [Thermoanaerobaculia bacterium]